MLLKKWCFFAGLLLLVGSMRNSKIQAQASVTYPANMYADSLHAPFYYGVASGDPQANSVLLWTHITPASDSIESIPLTCQVFTNQALTNIILDTSLIASRQNDFTVHLLLSNLTPYTHYYYQFSDGIGNTSAIGRTKTAPDSSNNIAATFAVTSCSSVYSGYFNGYQRIAERDEIDMVIHLGDYIYDFVDEDEEVRVPAPYPQVPNGLEEYRARHKYYLLDPNLRAARQQHPWMVIWDNHDVENSENTADTESRRAFYDYVPIRNTDTSLYQQIYRHINYGSMVDISLLDISMFRNDDEISPGVNSMLGDTQYSWLSDKLLNSTAQWHIVGSQKMMGNWNLVGLPEFLLDIFGVEEVFSASTWDGWPAERARLLNFLTDNNINNTVVISGDSHLSMINDLSPTPQDPSTYNPDTGEGSVAIEILPTSMSRGNMDEMGLPVSLQDAAINLFNTVNPHFVFTELISHGYGLLHFNTDSLTAEIWYSPILEQTDTEQLGARYVAYKDDNHWQRNNLAATITSVPAINFQNEDAFKLYPNPTSNSITLATPIDYNIQNIQLINSQGQLMPVNYLGNNVAGNYYNTIINTEILPQGIYWFRVVIIGKSKPTYLQFIKR